MSRRDFQLSTLRLKSDADLIAYYIAARRNYKTCWSSEKRFWWSAAQDTWQVILERKIEDQVPPK